MNFIIQNLCQEHVVSYCRILYCLIELKKVIEANHYAEIIKKKFGNQNCYSNFHEQLAKLEILNREFSDKILNQNPQLKQEVISMNNNLKINNEGEKLNDFSLIICAIREATLSASSVRSSEVSSRSVLDS